jgi:hypothetical protein
MTDWEDRLDQWELELELSAQLQGSDWVTLEAAAANTGVSRAALRNWYRTGQIASRLVDGPHGPQRLVPLSVVAARAEASPRLRKSAERRLDSEAQLELLRHRVDQLELRLAELERRQCLQGGTTPLTTPRKTLSGTACCRGTRTGRKGLRPPAARTGVSDRRNRDRTNPLQPPIGREDPVPPGQILPKRRSPASPRPGTM